MKQIIAGPNLYRLTYKGHEGEEFVKLIVANSMQKVFETCYSYSQTGLAVELIEEDISMEIYNDCRPN